MAADSFNFDQRTTRRVVRSTKRSEAVSTRVERAEYGSRGRTGVVALPTGTPPGTVISGLITSDLAGDGFYGGKSFQPIAADVDGSDNLTEAMLGGLAAEEDCVVANVTELGSSATGHDVTEPVNTDRFAIYFVGICRHVNADGKKLVEAAQFYVGCADA
jgi:hypothetical protein